MQTENSTFTPLPKRLLEITISLRTLTLKNLLPTPAPTPNIGPSLPLETVPGEANHAASELGRYAEIQGWESRQKKESTLKTWTDRSQTMVKSRKGVGTDLSVPAPASVTLRNLCCWNPMEESEEIAEVVAWWTGTQMPEAEK